MRGEDMLTEDTLGHWGGSPPHAWGRRRFRTGGRGLIRFTPTCVGKTVEAGSSETSTSVHPHMRGEDAGADFTYEGDHGSPPHAWGRRYQPPWLSRSGRFTPTCVGKTWPAQYMRLLPAVHPHMRGEDAVRAACNSWASGSPPHAWGRRSVVDSARLFGRFTPTCVGKTWGHGSAATLPAVHPHMRGEDGCPTASLGSPRGSPPHAWGRRLLQARRRGPGGSPPHAWGRLCLWPVSGNRMAVHPHMRGEDEIQMDDVVGALRFTPTCVGKTQASLAVFAGDTVHPHMRGEDSPYVNLVCHLNGSPPHAWGRREQSQ